MHLEKLTSTLPSTPQALKHFFRASENVVHKPGNGSVNVHSVFMEHIGHDGIFEPFPQPFDRIQPWLIRRQKEEMKAFSLLVQKVMDHLGMVDAGIVQHKHDQLVRIMIL